jgi:hypothetical protein
MDYRVYSKKAQLSLFNDDELPKTMIKPDSIKKDPNYVRFRKMVRKWNKSKPKT